MDKRTEILDAAEKRARIGGYNGFSFREIAEDVGIKSASVHYHFPTKEALGEAVADRYVERMREALGDPAKYSPKQALANVIALFVDANETDDLMCLCGIFGAESGMLPAIIGKHINLYFDELTLWLARALSGRAKSSKEAQRTAQLAVAALEGAMIIARTKNRTETLREVGAQLEKLATGRA